jgi:uncharacterized membrane protein YccC
VRAIRDEWGLGQIRTRAAAVADAVVPDWLAELLRPKPAPWPWPDMIRMTLAVTVPLGTAIAIGKITLGLLPALGGLLGTLTDRGGSYLYRVERISAVGVFGGAAGLAIGSAIHGRGWIAVVALMAVAATSALLSSLGDIGSQTGLQLLVYAAIGAGPFGALRPVWHTALGFLVGVVWALVLILPGWLLSPHGQDQRVVASVYQALADQLAAIGTADFATRRQAVTTAIGAAYDELLTARAIDPGRNRTRMRLVAALNASNLMAEAVTTLGVAGTRPPPLVIDTVRRLAGALQGGGQPPVIPPAWDGSPGALALREAMAGAARVLSRDWTPGDMTRAAVSDEARSREGNGVFDRITRMIGGGQVSRTFVIRLTVCMGVAGVVSEVLPLQRSYWVTLTVAIVLKPDYGSVFARALQRGIGTIVGAVLGAVLLELFHGTWLLIPFGVLAALLPYGRNRNYGLLATFLTPLVVVLVDLLTPAGWRLASDRLVDTLIGCAIVLVVGFAPWPMSWYAHLPGKFGQAARDVCDYMSQALGAAPASPAEVVARSRKLRSTYRALGELRTEFQRTMSEPPSISRGATAWWPALVGLESVLDAVTSVSLAVGRGASVPSSGVAQLCGALDAISSAAPAGEPVPAGLELPDDETLQPVTEAVRALLGVLASGQRPTGAAA